MKIASIALTLVAAILAVLGLLPGFADQQGTLMIGAAVAAGLSFVMQLVSRPAAAAASNLPAMAKAEQVSATTAASPQRAEAEVLSFLAALQEKGRLVDFLMDDVTAFDDAQVGAAARVVHEGCRAALNDCMTIVPVTESQEGATISIPKGHRADEYRLTGKLSGEGPFNGAVVHRGWKATSTRLPQVIVPEGELPCIAPAEVEVNA